MDTSSSMVSQKSGYQHTEIADFDIENVLKPLEEQLAAIIKAGPLRKKKCSRQTTDPDAQPLVWISKWLDYTDKYGFGYQLSDNSVGVVYNDGTSLIMLANNVDVHYMDQMGNEELSYTVKNYPRQLARKMKLLSFFQHYMEKHLLKAGGEAEKHPDYSLSRPPYVQNWFKPKGPPAVLIMLLTNGSLQFNFRDHSKIVLCPLVAAVTCIVEKNLRTYRFETIREDGCSPALMKRLTYAYRVVSLLISKSRSRKVDQPDK